MSTQRALGVLVLALPFLLLGVSGNPATSQVALANVAGVVQDSQGLAIPGAQVVIRNIGTGIETAAESNESGYFTLVSLNPGGYELAMAGGGGKRYLQHGVQLETGKQIRLDVVLRLGVVTAFITVTFGAPAIHLQIENRRRLTIRPDAFNTPNLVQLGNVSGAAAPFGGSQGELIARSRDTRIMQASSSYHF